MFSKPIRRVSVLLVAAAAAVAVAQSPSTQSAPAQDQNWVPPGTTGSPIDGETFHAQVLLDAAGFSAGTIDGRTGSSFNQAVRGFQEANGLRTTGKLDGPTRAALLRQDRPSTAMVKLTPNDVGGPFVYPLPKDPEQQAKLRFAGYRNMLEKLAERYHTTPETVVALNGPEKLIGIGQPLRLPNVLPASRDYQTSMEKQAMLMNQFNVDARQPKGQTIIVDKSDGVLKVFDASDRLVAQFRVTTGSGHDPLPLGTWKVTTYAFLPPFHYQPDLFWDVTDKEDEYRLPPGPNGLVGVAWLDLTKEHYGIHGTPEPQAIGKTESHGCLRMTNWDVVRLSAMLEPGFTAKFVA